MVLSQRVSVRLNQREAEATKDEKSEISINEDGHKKAIKH